METLYNEVDEQMREANAHVLKSKNVEPSEFSSHMYLPWTNESTGIQWPRHARVNEACQCYGLTNLHGRTATSERSNGSRRAFVSRVASCLKWHAVIIFAWLC